jgi:hypothetical protein
MNIEKIAVNGHYVWVDEAVGWSHNGICYNDDGTIGKPINSNSKKIIASSSELNLEGVPTYFEWLEANYYRELEKRREVAKNYGGQVAGRHPDMFGHNEVHHMVRGYLEGYQKANEEKSDELLTKYQEGMAKGLELTKELFTEDDVRKAIELAREGIVITNVSEWETEKEFEHNQQEIIEQLKLSKTK